MVRLEILRDKDRFGPKTLTRVWKDLHRPGEADYSAPPRDGERSVLSVEHRSEPSPARERINSIDTPETQAI